MVHAYASLSLLFREQALELCQFVLIIREYLSLAGRTRKRLIPTNVKRKFLTRSQKQKTICTMKFLLFLQIGNYVLCIYFVPRTIVGSGDKAVSKT